MKEITQDCSSRKKAIIFSSSGLTLIELLIAMVIGIIVIVAATSYYSMESKVYRSQRQISQMQQNLRGALHIIANDIRNGQRDSGVRKRYKMNFGNWRNMDGQESNEAENSNHEIIGRPCLHISSMRKDNNGDGWADGRLHIIYALLDDDDDDRQTDLYRYTQGSDSNFPSTINFDDWELVAENIEEIGYAYAFDADKNGFIERFGEQRGTQYIADNNTDQNNGGGAILWAVDSDNDGELDVNIDIDGDEKVTIDDFGTQTLITTDSNSALHFPSTVSEDQVRAVRLFLLARSPEESKDALYDEDKSFVVGNRLIRMGNKTESERRHRRRVMTMDVALRSYNL
ncbi:MAG: hypothetical protein GY874_18670 [Desulfobacteraceae bacterium]|nr:hypothetical protein [Desulfobacteraceae bacterium]